MLAAVTAVHLALATGRVDGRMLLGRPEAAVVRLLGRPRTVDRYPLRRDLAYDGIEVILGDGRHVSALLVTDPSVALRPAAMRARLEATAGLRERRRYRCDALGCFGTFLSADGRRRVVYGLERGRPYVGVQAWPQP